MHHLVPMKKRTFPNIQANINLLQIYLLNRAIAKNALGVAGANLLKKTGDYGYDPNVNHVRGNNSGTQALNFCRKPPSFSYNFVGDMICDIQEANRISTIIISLPPPVKYIRNYLFRQWKV